MKTADYDYYKYKKLLMDNCRSEWQLYCNSIDSIKSDRNKIISLLGNNWTYFWLEHGAFIKVLPRQIGKTTFLVEQAKLNNGIVISVTEHMRRRIKQDFNYDRAMSIADLRGLDTSSEWLFVDEYDFISKDQINILLNRSWYGVMMISSSMKGLT